MMKWEDGSSGKNELCAAEHLGAEVVSCAGDIHGAEGYGLSARWRIYPLENFLSTIASGEIKFTSWAWKRSEYNAAKRLAKSLLKTMDDNFGKESGFDDTKE
jgi:hypothetical protein